MALTFTFDGKFWIPKLPSLRIGRITLDNAYAAGGYAITAGNMQFKTSIRNLIPGASKGFMAVWDHANGKLMFYKGSAAGTILTEAANGEAGLNGLIIPFMAWGI